MGLATSQRSRKRAPFANPGPKQAETVASGGGAGANPVPERKRWASMARAGAGKLLRRRPGDWPRRNHHPLPRSPELAKGGRYTREHMHRLRNMHGPRARVAMVADLLYDEAGVMLQDVKIGLDALAARARARDPDGPEWGTNAPTITRALRDGEAQGWWAIDYDKVPGGGARVNIVIRFRIPARLMHVWDRILDNARRKGAQTRRTPAPAARTGRAPVDVAVPAASGDQPLGPKGRPLVEKTLRFGQKVGTNHARDG